MLPDMAPDSSAALPTTNPSKPRQSRKRSKPRGAKVVDQEGSNAEAQSSQAARGGGTSNDFESGNDYGSVMSPHEGGDDDDAHNDNDTREEVANATGNCESRDKLLRLGSSFLSTDSIDAWCARFLPLLARY